MSTVHVFAVDRVPTPNDFASNGGLRSLQIIEALRNAGHAVTYSIPHDCRHLRQLAPDNPAVRQLEVHHPDNQIELLRKFRPQIVVWLTPLIRNIPLTGSREVVHVCDLVGLQHLEATQGTVWRGISTRERLVQLCAGADLVLTGSEEQNGFWLAELSLIGPPPPTAIIPYALPQSMPAGRPGPKSCVNRLHVSGTAHGWRTSVTLLERAADWVAAQDHITLSLIIGAEPDGPADHPVWQRLRSIMGRPGVEVVDARMPGAGGAIAGVEMTGGLAFAATMADYGSGSIALDIRDTAQGRHTAVPTDMVNALTSGIPILSTVDATLTRRLAVEGAGIIASERRHASIEAKLTELASLSPTDYNRMSKAALGFARREHDAATVGRALSAAIADAAGRHAPGRSSAFIGVRAPGPALPPPHVLVISNVQPQHRELRVEVPFNALFGQHRIAGYTVWSRGDFRFTTSSDLTEQSFDAIWVQREVSPEVAVVLDTLNRPFVYDIDDNLLVSPSHRPGFSLELMQTVQALIRSCHVLSCSTQRLAQLLNSAASSAVINKVIVTQNLVREVPPPRPTGAPRFLIWGAGDAPAPTSTRLGIIKAVRDFCLARDLKMICMGVEPPELITESDVEVMHIRHIPYGSYLSLLRSFAPAIIACPLETPADATNADAINGKSDLKILEALAGGVVGVFSRALPYLESDLPLPILCEDSYRGWMEALALAWRQSELEPACTSLPPNRIASGDGTLPWLDALDRARLLQPLTYSAFSQSLMLLRGRNGRRLLSDAEFDVDFYLKTYPDVQVAIQQGALPSTYEHYRLDGFREGRKGRPDDSFDPHNEAVWVNLLQTLGDLRACADGQAARLNTLKTLRSTRQTFRRKTLR